MNTGEDIFSYLGPRKKKIRVKSKKHSKVYRVLCLGGGGSRGIMQAIVLHYLDYHYRILDYVDLSIGTSIGGLNSMLMATGYELKEIVRFYPIIFQKHIFKQTLRRRLFSFGGILFPKYDIKDKKAILDSLFSDKDLTMEKFSNSITVDHEYSNDFTLKRPFHAGVTIHNLNGGPELFTTYNEKESNLAYLLRKTSDAPTIWRTDEPRVDGGLSVNNPICFAKTEEKRFMKSDSFPTVYKQVVKKKTYRCLSITCGNTELQSFKGIIDSPQGAISWGLRLVDVFMITAQVSLSNKLTKSFQNDDQYNTIDYPSTFSKLDEMDFEGMRKEISKFIKDNEKMLEDYAKWFISD